ncbi:MAG TPA: NAD(P)/FAD-dependent oxidoreductase [Spirochaetota bacterium]|nr:NAD(P)/FAD-dependent oxidoreductase [Spirochaetota bacterium]
MKNDKRKSVAIIGGGASGLMAAWHAASGGARVTLFEKQKMLGRKVRATGNGRCNITNRNIDASFYHGRNPQFVRNVFGRFGLDDTIGFFRRIGIPFVELEGGRLYPASLQASTVTQIFEYELERLAVDIRLHRKIERLEERDGRLRLITAGQEEADFDAAVLAAGGCAYPQLGASRSGYELAAALDHTLHEPFPAILPINITLKALHRLEGIKRDCSVSVMRSGRLVERSTGELLFTKYGISGPAALEVSRTVSESLCAGETPEIAIDFFPDTDAAELEILLSELWSVGERPMGLSLRGLLRDRLCDTLLGIAGVDPAAPARGLSAGSRKAIACIFKDLRLRPGAVRSFNEAVVSAGGVDVGDVRPATLESRRVKNLYITGELLDIDGDSGGYNLQFAWSTGALAGTAASS